MLLLFTFLSIVLIYVTNETENTMNSKHMLSKYMCTVSILVMYHL